MSIPFASKSFVVLLILFVSACASPPPISEIDRLTARAQKVEIIRDDFGVPHIYGKTDADAVFGLLYAQAEDDFKRVERNYIWAIGRLAEVDGETAIYSDLRARLFMTIEQAKLAYESSPASLKALCDAFADGLNYYLATHPEVKPALLTKFEPWMPMFFSEGSIGGDIEQISVKGIKAFYGSRIDNPDTPDLAMAEPSGSNGFAISGKLTKSGHAMLLINPHTSFYFRPEVHVVSEEGLNAYGAVTWGQFFVYQGFNEKNGWMHTSTHVDFMDEYLETIIERGEDVYYLYDGDELKFDVSTVSLKYRDGDSYKLKTFATYRTHHGPVTHMINGQWVTTRINWDPVQALQQSFIRSKTSSHDEFRNMMDMRTNSSNNTVYADADGNIAYYHGNFIPKRDPRFDYSKPVNGSIKNTDWNGLHTVDETISILNPANGWIQNANSTPFTAAGEFSPKAKDYPTYMAPDSENYRGIHAVQVLTDQSDFTLDKLIEVAYDPYLPGFKTLISGLIKAYDGSSKPLINLAEPINALRQWDYRVSVDSTAMSLAHFYGMQYLAKGSRAKGQSFMQRIEHYGSGSLRSERLSIFEQAVEKLIADFGQWNTPWGDINRLQRLTGDIDLPVDDTQPSIPIGLASGRWGALAAFGARSVNGSKKLYGYRGNSFVAVVEFGEKVKAKSLLAGGQSGDPASPNFYDQAQRYAQGQFKDVAYYKEDVLKRAVERYRPGYRE
ncbi:acylase [Paraglaciecola arctica]|uniref:Penicillin amidase family protein n=1 Tax=Paraglaciecola arctica BSs20135 TaxID=493475 RepID=K6YD30_9ALTE|nr:acylase [Paraglaciecola arctica]GAC21816.1 penicillin amidase family protein [Paraglaciecola arctica BSs20135]